MTANQVSTERDAFGLTRKKDERLTEVDCAEEIPEAASETVDGRSLELEQVEFASLLGNTLVRAEAAEQESD